METNQVDQTKSVCEKHILERAPYMKVGPQPSHNSLKSVSGTLRSPGYGAFLEKSIPYWNIEHFIQYTLEVGENEKGVESTLWIL